MDAALDRLETMSNTTESTLGPGGDERRDPLDDLHLDLLDELDDVEFGIPPVKEIPTLESILKESDNGPLTIPEEDLDVNLVIQLHEAEVGSTISSSSSYTDRNATTATVGNLIDFSGIDRTSIDSSFTDSASRASTSLPPSTSGPLPGFAALRNSRLSLVSNTSTPAHRPPFFSVLGSSELSLTDNCPSEPGDDLLGPNNHTQQENFNDKTIINDSGINESNDISINGQSSDKIEKSTANADTGATAAASCSDISRKPVESTPSKSKGKHRKNLSPDGVIKWNLLKKISVQLKSTNSKIGCGTPSAIAVQNSYLAIGTSGGLVLLFDQSQTLKYVPGQLSRDSSANQKDQATSTVVRCPVSCLSINSDESRLLAGYASGLVRLFNLLTGDVIFTSADCYSPLSSVVHLKFTTDSRIALLSDSGGSVFELKFNRQRTKFKSEVIFSGSRGEVLALEPLSIPAEITDSLGSSAGIILAMATVSKVIVISLVPTTTVLFTCPLKGPAAALPLLAWQFVLIQSLPHKKGFDPVLAVARNHTIHFFQMDTTAGPRGGPIMFNLLQKLDLNYRIISFNWLNARTLLTLDSSECLHVIDIRSEKEIERLDISAVSMVYGTDHFRATLLGGQVSEAMALAASQACYHSAVMCNISASSATAAQFLLLAGADTGAAYVYMYTLKSWLERLDSLVKAHQHKQALQLALDFYTDKAQAVVGLRSSQKATNRERIADKMLAMVQNYLEYSEKSLGPSDAAEISEEEDFYTDLIGTAVKYCLAVGRQEFVLENLYTHFSVNQISKAIYFETLEPHILDGKLSSLGPSLTSELFDHYTASGQREWYERLERLVVHLDILSLDLDRTLKLCRAQQLYDGIFYIHNYAFQDYVTPLEELLLCLGRALNDLSDDGTYTSLSSSVGGSAATDRPEEVTILGNKILVYVSSCLAGLGYPTGRIPGPPERAAGVRREIISTLLKLRGPPPLTAGAYPYLKLLLRFDAREFLNVLSLAFEEENHLSSGDSSQEALLDTRQRIVDILLLIIVGTSGTSDVESNRNSASSGSNFSASDRAALFIFLARQLIKPVCPILINKSLVDQVIDHLTASVDDFSGCESQRFEERQQALLELVSLEDFPIKFSSEEIYAKAQRAKFFRVCEFLHQRERAYDKILLCYLDDPNAGMETFDFIDKILSSDSTDSRRLNLSEEEKLKFSDTLYRVESLLRLISLDPKRTAQLLLENFKHQNLNDLIKSFAAMQPPSPSLELDLLDSLVDLTNAFVPAIPKILQSSDCQNLFGKPTQKLDAKIYVRQAQLICQLDPCRMYSHLRGLVFPPAGSSSTHYPIKKVLEVCEQHIEEIPNAVAYLLELDGRPAEAYELLFGTVRKFFATVGKSGPMDLSDFSEKEFVCLWDQLIEFLNRYHYKPAVAQNDQNAKNEDLFTMYFSLLEAILLELQRLHEDSEVDQTSSTATVQFKDLLINRCAAQLIDSMVGRGIQMDQIIEKLSENNEQEGLFGFSENSQQFSAYRQMLMSMLENSCAEELILQSTGAIINSDLHGQLNALARKKVRGVYSGDPPRCTLCELPLKSSGPNSKQKTSIVMFHCSHAYHSDCLSIASNVISESSNDQENPKRKLNSQNNSKKEKESSQNLVCLKCDFIEKVTQQQQQDDQKDQLQLKSKAVSRPKALGSSTFGTQHMVATGVAAAAGPAGLAARRLSDAGPTADGTTSTTERLSNDQRLILNAINREASHEFLSAALLATDMSEDSFN